MNTVAIAGASGYIGQFLVAELIRAGNVRIKILSRSGDVRFDDVGKADQVVICPGDLSSPESLAGWLEPDCTVVNLVYLWNAPEAENLAVIGNLLEACKANHISRLIHCSTVAVVGRAQENSVNERTQCRPVTAYGITKLKVERAIIDSAADCYDSAVLRPTSVFGPNGNPIKKLADDLVHGSRWRNYLKSCLFGRRSMNLVPVRNVVAAIMFLITRPENLGGEIFNISDDDCPANNFADVERLLINALGLPNHPFSRVPVPPYLLSFLLACMGRNIINPHCNFSPDKLLHLGFIRPIEFETGLEEYATWYRSTFLDVERKANP